MVKIENGIIDEVSYKRSGHPLLVRYYAPEECSDCALNHMNDNFKYHSMSQREGLFDFIVVMAPPEKDRTRVIEKAMAMNNPLAIYIDSSYYLKNKGVIPSFPGFHLFLLDADGTPVFVGNPLQNESTKSRFNRRLGYLIY
ncbi:MAG: hypothetical protein II841_00630 [Bacteroidales bacterium]|nr:hypothetical protein [Bacteroidales bacterium]